MASAITMLNKTLIFAAFYLTLLSGFSQNHSTASHVLVPGNNVQETQKKPATKIDFKVGSVPLIKQPESMACWATAATIMVSWKENKTYNIEEVLARAGDKYLALYEANQGIDGEEKRRFLSSLKLRAEAPQTFTVKGWLWLLQTYGPLWVTSEDRQGKKFSVHARIVTGITGDESIENTFLTIIDPQDGSEYTENINEFTRKYENVARTDLGIRETDPQTDLRPQIVHF
jgi:Papain-like cysteine protease AvrRpt2